MEELSEVIQLVEAALKESHKHQLQAEVIATALISLRDNSSLTIREALSIGLNEYDI